MRVAPAIACSLLMTLAHVARAEPSCRWAVLDVEARGYPDPVAAARVLTDAVAAELERSGECVVVTQADLKSMMDFEAQKQSLACGDDTSCLAEIGNALGVDRFITGTVTALGGRAAVHVRLVDVAKAEVVRRVEFSEDADAARLRPIGVRAARELLGLAFEEELAPPLLLYAGIGVGALGVVGMVAGTALLALGESTLATPGATSRDKDGALLLGRSGLVAGAVSTLVAVGGGALLAWGLLE